MVTCIETQPKVIEWSWPLEEPKRVFVAGKWESREKIRVVMAKLETLGYVNAHDWTEHKVFGYTASELDMAGVAQCDIFIFVADEPLNFRGAYAELGAAIALNKRIILVGKGADHCIYSLHPLVEHVDSLEELYETLRRA